MIDLHMPGGDGVTAIRELSRVLPETRTVVLTMDDDDEAVQAAVRAGASGYLLKGSSKEAIETAVRSAAAGQLVFGPEIAAPISRGLAEGHRPRGATAFPHLSDRELNLLDLLATGLDNAAIAGTLGVAPKTVRNTLSELLTKLAVQDRAAAIALARSKGLGRSYRPA